MLVIGITQDKSHVSHDLEVDLDQDTASKIHNELKRATNTSDNFEQIIIIKDDEIVATYSDEDDYGDEEEADHKNDEEPDFDNLLEGN